MPIPSPSRRPSPSLLRHAAVRLVPMLAALAFVAAPVHAQSKGVTKPAADKGGPALIGTWSGTATVPLKDSSIVVPVVYTFTQSGATIGGTAMVPGQGAGPISDVVRSGAKLAFRVTAPEGKILEHDGAMTADGAIEGMVSLDKAPVAKFRITPKAGGATTK